MIKTDNTDMIQYPLKVQRKLWEDFLVNCQKKGKNGKWVLVEFMEQYNNKQLEE